MLSGKPAMHWSIATLESRWLRCRAQWPAIWPATVLSGMRQHHAVLVLVIGGGELALRADYAHDHRSPPVH
jgi:hypothetical protein